MKKYLLILLSILILFTVLGVAIATTFHGTAVGSETNVDSQTSDRDSVSFSGTAVGSETNVDSQTSDRDSVSFSGTAVGSWTNVDSQSSDRFSVFNYDEWSVAIFRWGMPLAIFDNQFTFNGKGGGPFDSQWIAEIGDPFLIGNFSYRNERTGFSSTVKGVDLNIALSLSSPTGMNADSFLFDFSFYINNTPNTTGDPLGDPLIDADIVTIGNTSPPAEFKYLDADYILEVLGFSSDGGENIVTNFINPEGSSKRAGVYGRISETAPVPEPATIFLLGVGLAGIAGFRIKSKKKRS